MKTLQEINTAFHTSYNEQDARMNVVRAEMDKLQEAARRYQRIAARKMGEHYKLRRKLSTMRDVNWVDDLLVPLLCEIEERTGWEFHDKNDLRTYGLRCECPVRINGEGVNEYGWPNTRASVTFTSMNTKKTDGTRTWELRYDTGEKSGQFAPGTIGAINGMNNVEAKVESVEQIIEFLRKQMEGND